MNLNFDPSDGFSINSTGGERPSPVLEHFRKSPENEIGLRIFGVTSEIDTLVKKLNRQA